MTLPTLSERDRLRLGATIASYLLAPNQGERPNPGMAHVVLEVALDSEWVSDAQRNLSAPYFDEPFFRRAAGLEDAE